MLKAKNQNEFMNTIQVSEYLNISKSQLYKLTSTRAIPHYCPTGKLLIFCKAEIEAWVKNSKVKTVQEVEKDLDASFNSQNRMGGEL